MIIPDIIRKCVAFLGYETKPGETRLAGTAFFISKPVEGLNRWFGYAVTARHVLKQIEEAGGYRILLRLNSRAGEAVWIPTEFQEWYTHPTNDLIDVAVMRFHPGASDRDLDHLTFPVEGAITEEMIGKEEVGIGDDVFLAGLFAHHHGDRRNLPIVRVGNIAAMPEEPVMTAHWGAMDAYLVECRSIGGLSGSPVFHVPGIQRRSGTIEFGTTLRLMGLMHGHFDAPGPGADAAEPDVTVEDRIGSGRVNMGIAIVVPVAKVLEVLDQPKLRSIESDRVEQLRLEQLLAECVAAQDIASPATGYTVAKPLIVHASAIADKEDAEGTDSPAS